MDGIVEYLHDGSRLASSEVAKGRALAVDSKSDVKRSHDGEKGGDGEIHAPCFFEKLDRIRPKQPSRTESRFSCLIDISNLSSCQRSLLL